MSANRLNLVETLHAAADKASGPAGLLRGRLLAIDGDGWLRVQVDGHEPWRCLWLEGKPLEAGDAVLVLAPAAASPGVVLGRIASYVAPAAPARLSLEATEVLTLKCGDATLDLRADGKAVLKGEDVLIRATGLQRIKAGSVSIN
ncbi:MAG: hypothetical protein L6Q65_01905 [Zoogloea sp.]|nr:hypothetical protein [Zoogloea sp.]